MTLQRRSLLALAARALGPSAALLGTRARAEQAYPTPALAIVGGEAIGPDLGHGPARSVTPSDARAVAAALASLTDGEPARRYSPQAMDAQHIYPTIWERDGQAGLDYLFHCSHVLTRFYADAARSGDAVLQWIS